MTEKLEPCPFCSGDAVMRRDDDPGYPFYVTFEHHQYCPMFAVPTDLFPSYSTEAEASAAWNTRPTPAAPEDVLEAMARFVCEWEDADPDASLGGDDINFRWHGAKNTLVLPLLAMLFKSDAAYAAAEEAWTRQVWRTDLHNMPRNGDWFWAYAQDSDSLRLVKFWDEHDRLPFNRQQGAWTTLPTHWMPSPQPPAIERREHLKEPSHD